VGGKAKMKTKPVILFPILLFAAAVVFSGGNAEGGETTISIIFDQKLVNPDLERRQGFGCVIKTPKANILFDTGYGSGAGKVLLSNMDKMNIDPMDIDMVVISHTDLTGGLLAFLEKNPNVTVYGPKTLNYKSLVAIHGAQYRELARFTKIARDIYSTGGFNSETNSTMEQSLVIDTEAGLVVVTGCAHPGIINVLERIKEKLPNRNFYLVMGGFHLVSATRSERDRVLEDFIELGVQKVSPCHCSGLFREIAKREYKENYIEGGVGQIIVIR
jgi:7,8-dihydropterin-6-yl-methyl-4-(beta-D-ribofuranosyl)aminobenzene 5'-phosphate synthase